MLKFIEKIFGGSRTERDVKKLLPLVAEINAAAERFQHLSEAELQAKTDEFRAKIRAAVGEIEQEQAALRARIDAANAGAAEAVGGDGQPAQGLTLRERQDLYAQLDDLEKEWLATVEDVLADLLPEAFGVVKEACRRLKGRTWTAGGAEITWDMVPYDVQLIGGIVLHRGRVAEMKTGEGKTLVAVAPVYLNALVGRGVHVVTVNPYLAIRDSEWMGPVFEYLGLRADCIEKYEPHTPGRREAYAADVTYGTNNEFGFDYLRDNSFVNDPEQLVQRHHHYAIVDEVDSVLIDEARTPLIISGPVPDADETRFIELRPPVDKLVFAQQKLVAQYVAEAEAKLRERDKAAAAGDKKRASQLEDEAGMALLRAQRGFPRNKRLIKLKGEEGVEQLLRKTEYFYLQDNAKQMPVVDEPLYFALDEKQHSIEMTDKGRAYIAQAAGEDAAFFVIPDLGEEIAKIDAEARAKAEAADSDEAREQAEADREEAKRQLYGRYAERNERIHAVNQLLRAYTMYEKDVEYIVQEGRVMIVDEHTGRVLPGRRYSEGLHQAIEAKEQVQVQAATQTYATITLQNYFRLYAKLAGMTGTAETEAEEFHKIYGMETTVIPTNRPIARHDKDDLVYKSKREKYTAVIDHIRQLHEKKQPVLVGTTSVEVSETLARMLKRHGIPHNVLNAKRDRAKAEADIVAEAGRPGAVTIATNMAGRGTDIKLAAGVQEKGGLAIIGTERHQSRRIDLQLRGRSGRQGDPGESVFYVSLEDDLMRLFGHDRTAKIMDRLGLEEGEVITHPWVTKGIERAQKKVEQNNFAIRKRQLDYDDVLNAQREVIYDRRGHALKGERLRSDLMEMIQDVVDRMVKAHYGEGDLEGLQEAVRTTFAFDYDVSRDRFVQLGQDGVQDDLYERAVEHYDRKRAALARPFADSVAGILQQPEESRPNKLFVDFTDGRRLFRVVVRPEDVAESRGHAVNDGLERAAILATIDAKWVDHLRDLDEVKEGVGLRAYGQKDPLVEYKMEAYRLFAEMMQAIEEDVVSVVFRAGPLVDGQPRRTRAAGPKLDVRRAQTRHDSSDANTDYSVRSAIGQAAAESAAERDPSVEEKAAPVVVTDKIGRNDVVTLLNPASGEKQRMKYKHAQGKLDAGWMLVDDEA